MSITGKFRALSLPDELDSIPELDQNFFPRPWGQRGWEELNPEHHHLFVWEQASTILGFMLFHYLPSETTAHLLKIVMVPEWRHKGTSQLFWREAELSLKESGIAHIYLEVDAINQVAIRFYEKLGFAALRRVKAYYSDGQDALMMQLTL